MNRSIKASILMRIAVSCLYVLFVFVMSQGAVLSALVGALACLLPESYQGWKIFKAEREYNPHKWLRLAHQSMMNKWLMTVMIFAISFSSEAQWNYEILFSGYLLVSVFGLLTPILIKGKK